MPGLSLDLIQQHSTSWFWKPESRGELSYSKLEGPANDFPLAVWSMWSSIISETRAQEILSPPLIEG